MRTVERRLNEDDIGRSHESPREVLAAGALQRATDADRARWMSLELGLDLRTQPQPFEPPATT
jgi:hypothetical protein